MIRLMNQNNLKLKPNIFRGLSSDKKPTEGVRNGDQFFEMDTGFLYMYEQADGVWFPTDFSNPDGVPNLYENISIVEEPSTTRYRSGETLDLVGLEIETVKMDGTTETVYDYTCKPDTGDTLTMEDTEVDVEYTADNGQKLHAYIPLEIYQLDHIFITKLPENMYYEQGYVFDLTGMEVTAYYTDGGSYDVTESVVVTPEEGTEFDDVGKQTITVSYTEGDVTATTRFTIMVHAGEALVGTAVVGLNYVGNGSLI